ncbi:hypothetical protein Taro_010738 [Colocasia esculenta]|uniref:Uncharacterized protein n=1 Tax=Colocasia esculenta TaxID=4460 RepID=A0A843U4E9_COLES|nr:hypothetical protein [Colocasia esculenta]
MASPSSCQEVPGPGGEAKRRRIRGEEGSLKFFPEFFKLLTLEEENDQRLGCRPCERDGPIGHVHKGRCDSALCRDLIATGPVVAIYCPT